LNPFNLLSDLIGNEFIQVENKRFVDNPDGTIELIGHYADDWIDRIGQIIQSFKGQKTLQKGNKKNVNSILVNI
jgi:hypothetical protein